MNERTLVNLQDDSGAQAIVAPELGGWLLRYSRALPKHGRVEALHCTEAIIARYPREMYAGIPVLFPLVSKNIHAGKEHAYEWEGQVHELPQHGFARRVKWTVTELTTSSVAMQLLDSDATRAVYPFSFAHTLRYELAQGRLVWEQVIENRSTVPMPFASGFHPYFATPLTPRGTREDCFVEIPDARRLTPVGNLERFSGKPFPGQNWSVQEDVAATLYLADLKRPELVLVDPGSSLEVVFNWEGAPQYRFAALWSKSTEEPFYCLEPWTALPNAFARTKDHELILLEPGGVFRASMWLELREMA